ncbi:MAG: hypothetical protein Ta2F_10810 [Termitinemataceae bacterium]|nr:MAG: hypothetical protein Ta2F_10810 [Termitinemataceae bacterium]
MIVSWHGIILKMNRQVFLVSFFFMIGSGLFALNFDSDHNFAIEAAAGLLNGQAEEIVFYDSSSKDKLSQLLWDIKPLIYAGANLHYGWHKDSNLVGVWTDAGIKIGIPNKTGRMEDSDWDNANNHDQLTHFSVHDNRTRQAILVDAAAGVSFNISKKHVINPFLSYSYMFFLWTANGGSILYPESSSGQAHRPISPSSKVVAQYTQMWNILGFGISYHGMFNDYFDADISFKISPLVWCFAVDNHVLRDLVITDDLKGGLFLEPLFTLSWTPKNFFRLSMSASYRHILGTRGNSTYKEREKTSKYKNNSGAGYSAFDIGITAHFNMIGK